MSYLRAASEGQLLLVDYLNKPFHYSLESYTFDTIENFDHYCVLDNIDMNQMSAREIHNILHQPDYSHFFSDLPFRYLLLDVDWLYNGDFLVATNFIAAFLNILEFDDYDKREILNIMLNEECPIIFKFKIFPRDIDEYPLNESDVSSVLRLYNNIPFKFQKNMEKAMTVQQKNYELDL